jgi:PUA domain protein
LSKKHHRYYLKEKETKKIFLELSKKIELDITKNFSKKNRVAIEEIENYELILFNKKPIFAKSNDKIFPILTYEEFLHKIPRIVVDMGAIPYVCKGADIMAPGVVLIEREFKEKDIVLIVDERYGKALAVGLALFSYEKMKDIKEGKIIKNLHYVGDKIWKHIKSY